MICTCGHKEIDHPSILNNLYAVCDGCFKTNRIHGIKQFDTEDCIYFRPDNLRYLENEYEQSTR